MKDIIKRQVMSILERQAISGKCRIILNGRSAEICNVDSVYVDGDGVLIAECLRLLAKDKAGTINKVNTGNFLRTMGEKR
jgi:aerobic-type carbon monoxide dehydrogenase small subunit (CoxS/CutS family)